MAQRQQCKFTIETSSSLSYALATELNCDNGYYKMLQLPLDL